MRITLLSTLILTAASAPAFAGEFQGTLHLKMTSPHGNGGVTVYVAKAGVRSEIDLVAGEMPMKMTVLVKSSNPDTAYNLNEKTKTYGEIDLKKAKEMAGHEGTTYSAKKIGNEKVLGYDAVHGVVTDSRGTNSDVWAVKGLIDDDAMAKMMHHGGPANQGMIKALKEAGVEGFWVKMQHKDKSGNEMTMELDKLEKKAPPASMFELPSGYSKDASPLGALPPDVQERMKEKLKNMKPEEREQMMKMLQQKAKPQGAGAGQP